MDLFERSASFADQVKPVTKIERVVDEVMQLRLAGEYQEAIQLAETALTSLESQVVRRELRSSLPRELAFAQLLAGETDKARTSLLVALEQAAHDPALADPIRAGLAACDLMAGAPDKAAQMLESRGRPRRANLSAQARLALYEGDYPKAEHLLQEAEQASGGMSISGIVFPPSALLRCFSALWSGRPDQARMLYDGVGESEDPLWNLARVALSRATWVQQGDARYLAIALATTERLRYDDEGERDHWPGLKAAIVALHAACLHHLGETKLAVQIADQALTLLRASQNQTLPEWPAPAILSDLAMIFRDNGEDARWQKVLALWDGLKWGDWPKRMEFIAGARMRQVFHNADENPIDDGHRGDFYALAVNLLEDPRKARLLAMRALGARTRALGVRWKDADGELLGQIGAQIAADELRIPLRNGAVIFLSRPDREALSQIEHEAIEALARVVQVREHEAARVTALEDSLLMEQEARRLTEERYEQVRRPGTERGHGGRFPDVIGRSPALIRVLNQLGSLARIQSHVLFVGTSGSGRAHLAQALFQAEQNDPTGTLRAPSLDLSLVPAEEQLHLLENLEAHAELKMAVLQEIQYLNPEAASWLLERLAATDARSIRWALTSKQDEDTPLIRAFDPVTTRVQVPHLNERLEDLPLLVDHFVREAKKRPEDLSTATRAYLARRLWPGGVSELRRSLREAIALAGQGLIQPEHFDRPQNPFADAIGGEDPFALGYHDAVKAFQSALAQRALNATAGHVKRAADLLGLSPQQAKKVFSLLEK